MRTSSAPVLALVLVSGCFASHGREASIDAGADCGRDGGRDAGRELDAGIDAPVLPDARPDAREVCVEGSGCDDADPCTTADVCSGGTCSGVPMVCDGPPPAECADASTLRIFAPRGACEDGECSYAPVLRACPDGCEGGACRCVATPWITEVVDVRRHDDGGPSADAISIDRRGGIHVVYPQRPEGDSAHTQLYAHRPPGGTWQIEPVGRGWYGSIEVAPDGTVHVVYLDEPLQALVHAVRTASGSWARSPVPVEEPHWLRTAIGDDGVLHVAVAREWGGVVHASLSTGGWAVSEIDERGRLGALTVDPRGVVHMVYATTEGPQYAQRAPGGAWVRTPIAPAAGLDFRMDVDVDPDGGVHALFSARGDLRSSLVHAFLSPSGTWEAETLGALGAVESYGTTMEVDARGVLHSAHHVDRPTPGVRYAARDRSGAWSSEMVYEPLPFPRLTFGSALALDGHGALHLVFKDGTHALIHASRRVCP